jgi:hypothetical protein
MTCYKTPVNTEKTSTLSTLHSLSSHSFHQLIHTVLTAPSERWPVEDGSIWVQMEADVLGLDFLQGGGDLGAGRQVQGRGHLLSHLLIAVAPHGQERDGDGSGDKFERKLLDVQKSRVKLLDAQKSRVRLVDAQKSRVKLLDAQKSHVKLQLILFLD